MGEFRTRVLVVDADEHVARMIGRVLGRTYEVLSLSSVEAALGRIRAGQRFDLILCDLVFPGSTGMDFRERVGLMAPDVVDRIVIMTGGAFLPHADALVIRSGVPYLEKPFFSIGDLRAAVREHLYRLGVLRAVGRSWATPMVSCSK